MNYFSSQQQGRFHFSCDLFLTAALWIVFGVVATFLAFKSSGELGNSVTAAYAEGAVRWVNGEPLYETTIHSGHGVVYHPQSCILWIPFIFLSEFSRELVWRLLCVGIWGYATFRLTQRLLRTIEAKTFLFHFLGAVVVVFMSLPAARCGQYTLPMAAAILLCTIAIVDRRWNTAAAWLFLAMMLKPQVLPYFLTVFVCFPPMRGRILLAIIGMLVFPFFFQYPTYVWEQCVAYPQALKAIAAFGDNWHHANLTRLAVFCGIDIPPIYWTIIRGFAAMLVLVMCWRLLRRKEPYFVILWLYSLPILYLELMSSRTESNSYAIIAPLLLSYLSMEIYTSKNKVSTVFLVLLLVGFIGHFEIFKFFVSRNFVTIACPLLTLALLVYVGGRRNVFSFADVERLPENKQPTLE